MGWLLCPGSQGQNQDAGGTGLFSEGPGEEFAPKPIQLVGDV